MIQSHELRIGNYILVDNEMKKVCCIQEAKDNIQTLCIGFEKNNRREYEEASSDRLSAVPISDALLGALGFTFHPYHKTWQHSKPKRTSTIELDRDFSAVDFSHRELVKNVQYLHLLQNLFFSIQKEELQFTAETSLPIANLATITV